MGLPRSLWWPGGAAWPRGWGSPLTGRGRGGDRGPEWTAEGLAAPAGLAGLGGGWAGSWVRGELQAWAPVALGRAGAGRGLLRCHYRLSAGHDSRPCWLLPPRRPLNCLWAPWCLSTTGVGGVLCVGGAGGAVRGGSSSSDRPQQAQTCCPVPGGREPAPCRAPLPSLQQQEAGILPSLHEPQRLLVRLPSDAHGCRVLWPPALLAWRFPRMSPIFPPTPLRVRPRGEAPWGGWQGREAPSLHSQGPAPARGGCS